MSMTRTVPCHEPDPCPHCCGEGYLITIGAPGRYDPHQEAWFPSETIEPCPACQGTGLDLREDHERPRLMPHEKEGVPHDHPTRQRHP